MTKDEFRNKLFLKLVKLKEFGEDDRDIYDKHFEEFSPTWAIFLEMINEEIAEATKKEFIKWKKALDDKPKKKKKTK